MIEKYKDTNTGDDLTLPEILNRYIQINGTHKGFEEYVDGNFMNGNEQEYIPIIESRKYVRQYTIDVEEGADSLKEDDIAKIIEDETGCTVRGVACKATWIKDDYDHGRRPTWF